MVKKKKKITKGFHKAVKKSWCTTMLPLQLIMDSGMKTNHW